MSASRLNQIFIWIVVSTVAAVVLFSGAHLSFGQLDIRFLILALATILIGPRLSIPIPRVKAYISVSRGEIDLTTCQSASASRTLTMKRATRLRS